jgi:hypothetical protein
MNIYTPLVIGRNEKNKLLPLLLRQRKLALTANLLHYKIIGIPQKFKNQQRPLFRPSFVIFCQNFLNQSHETVPLRPMGFVGS